MTYLLKAGAAAISYCTILKLDVMHKIVKLHQAIHCSDL